MIGDDHFDSIIMGKPDPGPSMDPPAWMEPHAPGAVRYRELYPPANGDRIIRLEVEAQRVTTLEEMIAERRGRFRGQTEGFAVGVGLGILLAIATYLSR
jgi:hypothetical protein